MATTPAAGVTSAGTGTPRALPAGTRRRSTRSGALTATERRGARLAGIGLLTLTLVSVPAVALLDRVDGTATTTAPAAAAFLLVAALDVLVGWGLYVLLGARAQPSAHAALVSRVGYAVLLTAAAARLAWPGGDGVDGFRVDWSLARVVLGLHLLIAAVALWRSRIAPGVLVVVTALSGAAYLLAEALSRFTDESWRDVPVPFTLAELALVVWLLVVGVSGRAHAGRARRRPTGR